MRVLGVFVGVIGAFACALAWLGWQFLENNRSIEDHRVQQELIVAAGEVAASFKKHLRDLASRSSQQPPPGVVWLTIRADGISIQPSNALAYYPALPGVASGADSAFAAAETLEFHGQRSADAAAIYRHLAESPQADIRAGALVRLGRVLRQAGRHEEALRTFDQLAAESGSAGVEQIPADLVARESRCRIFASLGRREDLQREASIIQAGLESNRWQLLRPAREFYTEEAAHWGVRIATGDRQRDSLALSAAAAWLFYKRPAGDAPVILQSADGPVLLYDGALAAPSYLQTALRSRDPSVQCALLGTDGRVLAGNHADKGPSEVRAAYSTGLPWNLAATFVNPDADMANYTARRRILFFGFAVVALVLAAGSYYILRSIAHEQSVARLQSHFVSAVSHELRTPLSSIVQISEMLAADRVPHAETGPAFEHLVLESRRLQKLVESLLDFGRMESRAAQYSLQPLDVDALVRSVVAEFQKAAHSEIPRIAVQSFGPLPVIHADREALSLAIWNLLDNAAKYSPPASAIEVLLAHSADRVMISVRDHGMGIPQNEQKDVFKNFFRGSASRGANIKGTGIGLAMVRQIMEAHRGEVTLTSEPGNGSTFTLRLPAGGPQ